jgi:predicted ATP-dependent protease
LCSYSCNAITICIIRKILNRGYKITFLCPIIKNLEIIAIENVDEALKICLIDGKAKKHK